MSYYFVIVGTRDNPLYEASLSSSKFPVPAPLPPNVSSAASLFASGGVPGYGNKNSRHVMQMVAHASLDVIEEAQWTTATMYGMEDPLYLVRRDLTASLLHDHRYMKAVDRFHEWNVSAWATPGGKLVQVEQPKVPYVIRCNLRNEACHSLRY